MDAPTSSSLRAALVILRGISIGLALTLVGIATTRAAGLVGASGLVTLLSWSTVAVWWLSSSAVVLAVRLLGWVFSPSMEQRRFRRWMDLLVAVTLLPSSLVASLVGWDGRISSLVEVTYYSGTAAIYAAVLLFCLSLLDDHGPFGLTRFAATVIAVSSALPIYWEASRFILPTPWGQYGWLELQWWVYASGTSAVRLFATWAAVPMVVSLFAGFFVCFSVTLTWSKDPAVSRQKHERGELNPRPVFVTAAFASVFPLLWMFSNATGLGNFYEWCQALVLCKEAYSVPH